jgi:CubicO group peptidase (beta-lactamase class C family)
MSYARQLAKTSRTGSRSCSVTADTHDPAIAAARRLLTGAIRAHLFPAAVSEIGDRTGVLWREAFGTFTFPDGSLADRLAQADTVFDLASLTKPLATTSTVMDLIAQGRLALEDRVSDRLDEWRGGDREGVTICDLLEHASGLAARLVDRPPTGRREFQHDICTMRLEYAPRSKSVYSDLGFILLGFIVEDADGRAFDAQFAALQMRTLRHCGLTFAPSAGERSRIAPTRPLDEDLRRGQLLIGEVHDEYAAALGGVAGHAGLFGTAADVGELARLMLRGAVGGDGVPEPFSARTVSRTIRKTTVPGSSRALGWDTMLPTSSCGSGMSPAAFGHVGFTGTSLWIDPILDRYFVLLTNRACDGGTLDEMRELRRGFHDIAVQIAR